jgi:hypothetical protein
LLALCTASAQPVRVGEINFYGLRKLPKAQLLTALGLQTGGPLPSSKADLEERLTEMEGIADARIEAVCCEGASATLFIGVEERDGPHFDTRNAPSGDATLPDNLVNQYRDYVSAAARARTADPQVKRLEAAFAAYAADNLELLRDVLRNGSEAEHRAVAATVIGYAPKKAAIVNDLQYALQDPDDAVRANAAKSLQAIALLAQKDPASGIRVAPAGLVEMLNSVVLGDRLQAMQALVILTDRPNAGALDLLRERALPALTEMARWKALDYALPAFLLAGRVGGIPESELHDQWSKGDRETAVRRAAESAAGSRR